MGAVLDLTMYEASTVSDQSLQVFTRVERLSLFDATALQGTCFARMSRLRHLTLMGPSSLAPHFFAPLAGTLRVLSLTGVSERCRAVGMLTGLRDLELRRTAVADADVAQLTRLRRLWFCAKTF